jgi:hypothetical protein
MGASITARPVCLTAIIYTKFGGKERKTLRNLYMADQSTLQTIYKKSNGVQELHPALVSHPGFVREKVSINKK